MKKVNLFLLTLTFISFTVFVSSCKKDETTTPSDTSFAEDDSFAEKIFDNITDMADEGYELGNDGNREESFKKRMILGDCATITLDTTGQTRTLIIDFGEENCLCLDGKYRRGKIITTWTGRYRHPGTVISHGFEDYHVNDHHVDGTKVVTNMGFNEDENMYFTIEVVGVIHLANDLGTISWNASKEREWIQGFDTGNRWDDIYLLTGTASGIRANGATWEREILEPLRLELVCRFIVSGTVEIRPEDKPVRLLDFGNGECDNIATVTINGEVYTIYLR